MTTVIVNHTVADYAAWRPAFDAHGTARDEHGCKSADVFRGAQDPNEITIVMTYPSLDAAQAFLADPSLKTAMANAGVQGAPDIRVVEPV